jgi:hypothetical protein
LLLLLFLFTLRPSVYFLSASRPRSIRRDGKHLISCLVGMSCMKRRCNLPLTVPFTPVQTVSSIFFPSMTSITTRARGSWTSARVSLPFCLQWLNMSSPRSACSCFLVHLKLSNLEVCPGCDLPSHAPQSRGTRCVGQDVTAKRDAVASECNDRPRICQGGAQQPQLSAVKRGFRAELQCASTAQSRQHSTVQT